MVIQIGLFYLNWTLLIAKHELLESQVAQVPGISFLIGDEMTKTRGVLDHRSNTELPHAAIDIGKTVERSPVLKMLRLVGGQRHHSNIGNGISVSSTIIHEFSLVKDQHAYCGLPCSGYRKCQEALIFPKQHRFLAYSPPCRIPSPRFWHWSCSF